MLAGTTQIALIFVIRNVVDIEFLSVLDMQGIKVKLSRSAPHRGWFCNIPEQINIPIKNLLHQNFIQRNLITWFYVEFIQIFLEASFFSTTSNIKIKNNGVGIFICIINV